MVFRNRNGESNAIVVVGAMLRASHSVRTGMVLARDDGSGGNLPEPNAVRFR